MMKSEKKHYGLPSIEVIPLQTLECYCGISGGDYHGQPGEYDDDSD